MSDNDEEKFTLRYPLQPTQVKSRIIQDVKPRSRGLTLLRKSLEGTVVVVVTLKGKEREDEQIHSGLWLEDDINFSAVVLLPKIPANEIREGFNEFWLQFDVYEKHEKKKKKKKKTMRCVASAESDIFKIVSHSKYKNRDASPTRTPNGSQPE